MMAALSILSVSLIAQDSAKHKMKMQKNKSEKITYACPMHPEVISNKQGKCPKCGMDLIKSQKEKMKMEEMKTYVCPMHPEVTSDKPGKCPKCGMELKEKVKTEIVYACPMKCEGDKTYDKAGKCPVCGMALKEKKVDNSDHNH